MSMPARSVSTLFAEPDGTLWVAVSEGGGLVHFDTQQGVIGRFTHDANDPASLSSYLIEDMKREPQEEANG